MKSIYLIAISTLFLMSCKSKQAVAENSGNTEKVTEKKSVTEKKHFDATTYDASKIESVSLDANHPVNRVHVMEEKVVVIQDTIKQ